MHDRITGRIARRHRARQAVAAGGAALAVGGIVAGSAVLHGAVGSHPVVAATTTPTTATAPAATGSTATPSTSPTSTVTRRGTSGATVTSPSTTEGATPLSVAPPAERAAFSGGGYDLGDAQELARLWGAPDAGLAKAVAGRRLLDGGSLPIEPGHRSSRQPTNYVAQAVYRFFGAGFDYDDAVRLAQAVEGRGRVHGEGGGRPDAARRGAGASLTHALPARRPRARLALARRTRAGARSSVGIRPGATSPFVPVVTAPLPSTTDSRDRSSPPAPHEASSSRVPRSSGSAPDRCTGARARAAVPGQHDVRTPVLSRPVRLGLQALALLGVVGGTAAFAGLDHSVEPRGRRPGPHGARVRRHRRRCAGQRGRLGGRPRHRVAGARLPRHRRQHRRRPLRPPAHGHHRRRRHPLLDDGALGRRGHRPGSTCAPTAPGSRCRARCRWVGRAWPSTSTP
nr:hypothetical protein [Angustibacter aerolatus]